MRRIWLKHLGAIVLSGAVGLLSSANAQIDNITVQMNKKFFSSAGVINPTPNPGEVFRLRINLINDSTAPVFISPVINDFFTDDGTSGGARTNTGLVTTTDPPTFRVVSGTNCGAGVPLGPTQNAAFVTTNSAAVSARPVQSQVTIGAVTIPAESGGTPGRCSIEIDVLTLKTGNNINELPAGALNIAKPGGGFYQNQPVSENVNVPTVTAPSVDKGFGAVGAGSVVGNSVTLNTGTPAKLTIRIRNNDSAENINDVTLTDIMPAGLTISTSPAPVFSSGCQAVGAVVPSAVLTPALNPTSVALSVPRIPANSNCDVDFEVTGSSSGTFNNTIAASSIGTREQVTNSGAVTRSVTYQSLDSAKSFDAPTTLTRVSTANSQTISTTLRLTITNRLSTAVNNVDLTDFFTTDGTPNAAILGLELDSTANITSSCGGTIEGANNIPNAVPTFAAPAEFHKGLRVTGMTVPAFTGAGTGTCTITAVVRGQTGISNGNKTNTLLAANITASGNQAVFQDRTATVNVVPIGVTGTQIAVQKDSSNSADAAGNLIAAPVWNNANAAILRDVAPNPASTTSGFHRIILRLPNSTPPGAVVKPGLQFTDDLPNTPDYDQVTNTGCGAPTINLTSVAGDDQLVFTGGTLTSNTDCIITFRVKSATAGTFNNNIPAFSVTTTDGTSNINANNANIIVRDALTISKTFAPNQVGPNGLTRLTVNVTNNDFSRPINITNLSDDLAGFVTPDDLTIAALPQISTTCDQAGGVIPATVGVTGTTVAMTNAQLPAAGPGANQGFTCSYSLFVNAPSTPTNQTNEIPVANITSAEGVTNTNPASAVLTVSPAQVVVDKIFATPIGEPGIIDPGIISRLEISLTNNNAYTISGLDLTDFFSRTGIAPSATPCSLPAVAGDPADCALQIEIANPANASSTCTAPVTSFNPDGSTTNTNATPTLTAVAGSKSVQMQNGAVAANSTCKILVDVTGFIGGNFINRIPQNVLISDQRATNTNGGGGFSTQSTLTVFTTFAMVKSFNPTTVIAGTGVSRLRLTVRNAFNTPLTALNISDFFTSDGLSGGTPTGMRIAPVPTAPTTTCGGTVTAAPNATTWSLSGGTLAAGAACDIEVDVVANKTGTSSAPTFLNQIPRSNASANTGVLGTINPRNGTQATLNTTFIPPTVAKSYNPTRIEPGATTQLTIVLSNFATAGIATLTAPFTDNLNASLAISSIASSVGCNAAALSTTTTAVTYAATTGTIPAAVGATPGTCTIVLNVTTATPTTEGTFVNTIATDALQTDRGSNPAPVSATLNVRYPFDGFKAVRLSTDADNSGTITVGDTVTWSVFYKNTGSAAQTNFQITDIIPGTMLVTAGTQTVSRNNVAAPTLVNPAFNGTSNTNLLNAGVTIAINEVIQVEVPAVVQTGATSLSNQTDATATNVPAGNSSSDNIDTTTTGLPSGVVSPAGSVPQTAAAGQNPTTAPVLGTPTVAGWKFAQLQTDLDLSQSPTVGDTLRWTIFFKNTGLVNLTNVSIADSLPTNVTQVGQAQISRQTPPATAFGADSNTTLPTAVIATIIPNEVIRITVDTTINNVATPFTLNNQATLTAANLPIAGVSTDNTDPLPTDITAPTNPIVQPAPVAGATPTQVTVITPVTVSGRVYNDVNNDGTRGTDPGIEGVTITILFTPPTGAPFTITRVTDVNGDYSAIVPSGSSVQITETQPAGFGNGTQNPSNVITLTNVTTNQTLQDFGERTGAISGQVFQDNGASNGVFVATDTALANQCITLTGTDFGLDGVTGGTGVNADTAVTLSTRTDASGNYSFAPNAANTVFSSADCTGAAIPVFAGLKRGTYNIEQRNQPVGTTDGITTAGAATTGGTAGTPSTLGTNNPDAITPVVLGAGQTSSGNNFAELAPSSIGGVVFQTNNNDNIQQVGEPGIGGVTVTLTGTNDLGQVLVITTTTAPTAVVGGGTVTNNVSINGAAATPVVVTVPASGVPVGGYYFGNLRPATYNVAETQPATFISTVTNTAAGTGATTNGTPANNVITNTVLGSNQNSIANNFGELPPGTLSGRVFRTVVNDNTFQASDVGLGGETITLTGTDDIGRTISITTTTASAVVAAGGTVTNNVSINGGAPVATTIVVPAGVPVGGYFFGQIPPSNGTGYTVTETTQPALHSSTVTNTRAGNPANGTAANNVVSGIAVVPAANLVNYDFAELQSDLSITKTISNPNPNVGDNVTFTITVTNNGFSDNTGITVRDRLPNGYIFVSSNTAIGSVTRSTVGTDEQLDWNVGALPAAPAVSSSAVLTVIAQVNATGTRANFAQVRTADVTDPDSQPNNNAGITPPFQDDETAVAPTSVVFSSLSGKVFRSVNNDNVQAGASETGIGSVPMTLTGTDIFGRVISITTTTATATVAAGGTVNNQVSINGGAPVSSTVTVPAGLPVGGYFFGNLAPSTTGYTVTETQPALFSSTITNTLNGAPVNGTSVNNVVSSIVVAPGSTLVSYDFAELQSDLSITKSIDVALPTIGQNVVFTITVTNNGLSDNTGVTVRDLLPSGYSFISSTPAVGSGVTSTTVAGGNQLDWTVGNLNASSSQVLLVRATVLATGNYTNFTQVQSATVTDPDSVPGDNTTGNNTPADDDAEVLPTVLAAPSISGFVYLDVNNNGTRDGGESGLANPNTNPAPTPVPTITLTGTDINGNPVSRTAIPDPSTGAWSIAGLLPPQGITRYTLTETQPTNYSSRTVNVGTGATINGSASNPTNQITQINLQGGEAGINFNFGELLADLIISKVQVGGTTIQAGQTGVQFQIIAVNTGPTQTTGVVVRDFLPSGYIFVSSVPAPSSNTVVAGGRQLEWNVGTLNNGQSNSIIVTVDVDANAANVTPTSTRNLAQIQASSVLDPDSTPGDNTTTNDTASDDDAISSPTISGLNSLAGRSYLDVNDNGVFDAGDLPLAGVELTLTGTNINGAIVPQTAFTSGTGEYVFTNLLDTPGTTGAPSSTGYTVTQTQPVTTTNRSTTVGDSAGTANSTGGASSGGQVTNIQLIGTSEINRTEINFGELRADLNLEKTVISPVPPLEPQVGSNVTFRLNVTNSGETRATGIVVQDVLPAGYSFVSASNPSATNTAGTITWNVGALNTGASSSVDVVATVVANRTALEYTNAAQITASDVIDPDSQPNNGTTNGQDDTASVLTTPIPVADLRISKTDGITAPATINAGSSNTYTIVVTNAGPSNVTGAGVTDTLPAAFYAVAGRTWQCVAASSVAATCPILGVQTGDLATNVNLNAGSSLTFTVTGTLLNPLNGTISNTATVVAPVGVVDPTPANNNATDTTPIANGDVIGVVFVDTNGNGTQDLGEPGIPNIDVTLTDILGNSRTVSTNGTGQYTFTNVPAGAATVDVITADPDFPAQHIQTAGTDPSPVTVVSGGTVANLNPADALFDGYQPRGDVNGIVYIDTNGDGDQDPGEVGIPNITVTLTDPFGVPRTAVTGPNGDYSFTGVPAGISTIDVDTTDPDFPADHVQTAGTPASPVTVVFGQNNNAGIDGFQPRGDVVGVVFFDTNGDGDQDAGELGIPNVDVRITDAFGGTRVVTTNGSGQYTALSVPASATPATVDVLEPTLPVGLTQTAGIDTSTVIVQVSKTVANANPNDAGFDGYRKQGTVTGVVFTDTNGDGIQNPGEPGIPNVDVQITDAGGKVITVTTGSDGRYTAPGVLEGTANVNVVDATLPPNVTQTAGTDSSTVNVLPNVTNDAGIDGYRPQGSVFGRVFIDTNGDGDQDAGELGIPNVSVEITDSAGNTVTVQTNATGDYSALGVLTGAATVNVVDSTLPVGLTQTAGIDSSTVNVLPNVANDAGIDGYRKQGTVVGVVFIDTNGDGVQNPSELGIPNVSVQVTDAGGKVITVITDADGKYTAPGVLEGTATVDVIEATLPPNLTQTAGIDPSPVTVLPNVTNDAGIDGYRSQGSVFGRVFLDPNGNGIQDPGEVGIPNVTINLTDSAGNVQTAVTNATGDWSIVGVLTGDATVKVVESTLPVGVVLTTIGSDPNVVAVLPNIANNAGNDGYQQRGTITGLVWRDDNGDGIRNPNEPIFPNVLVTITDLSGNPIEVRTDANGVYTSPVAAGPVTVVYTTPDNHRLTTDNSTQVVNVPPAGVGTAADVGYQPLFGGLTGRVFYDTNNNGVQDANEPGIAGVNVEITDSKGNKVTVVTDANGDYATGSRDLAFGPATVLVIDPAGHVLTTNNNPQVVQVPAGSIGRVPDVGYVKPSIRLEKNVVIGDQVIPRDQQPPVVVGGTLGYQINTINNGVVTVSNVVITDTLPLGLKYVAGSSSQAGVAIADPVQSVVGGKDVLVWTLTGTIAPNASKAIRFKTIITPAANNGALENRASASAKAGTGATTVNVESNASIAAVKVSLGIFAPRTTIVGRVYFDNNNNDSFERGTDEPVPGARVYLSDGRWSVTDDLGRYSIPEVAPGRHAVRLDPITAPFTCKRVPDDAPCTRFVVAPETGGITIEDFLLNAPTGVVVKSRSTLVQRGPVTLTKVITQGGAGYAVTITITLEKAVQNLVITDPLPSGTVERGTPQISSNTPFTFDGSSLRFTGTVPAGTYTITYPLFTPLPPDLVLTDPDISYEEIFTLIPLPAVDTNSSSDEVIR